MEKVLKIKNLTFGYTKDKLLYKNFSLEIKRGEIVSIVGPSGIGKSTLFELIAGFLKPISGEIEVKKFSQIYQDPYTSFHPTYKIIDQIADVCDIKDIEKNALKMNIEKELLYKVPHELSGGQLQRCSILRAIMMKPDLILADEPTSALDNIIQLQVMKLLVSLLDKVGILLITHDLNLAKWCSDNIIMLVRD
ncbi:ATP-binding cassette domain-containing protein [Nitrosophilus kaiyonis]|uniref:ATP-binding cassette domain-containing protein n=1 Tax=Nitrosophilus kaiyonis TaxID=2930200 RepID=UPI0024908B30|nr:ATP-binding cassette domain-containing protein [Nitrosophilus kaiyonis]